MPVDLEEPQRVWPAVLDQLAQNGAGAGGDLRGARPVGARRGRRCEIGFPADATFNKRKAEAPEQARAAGRGAARRSPASDCSPAYVLLDGERRRRGGRAAAEAEEIDEEELLERLKSEFDAEEVS